MAHFFSTLPKTLIAFVVIAIGFALMVFNDPPKSMCDSQLGLFQQGQAEFIYGRNTLPRPLAPELFVKCKSANTPGGCFELFQRLKKLSDDLESVSHQCSEAVAVDPALRGRLEASLKLFAKISWGDRGPASGTKKNAWLDSNDLALFCGLKKNSTRLYGVEVTDQWRKDALVALPETEKLDADQLFENSIYSTSCDSYR